MVRAVCKEAMTSPEGLRQFARAWIDVEEGRYVVKPVGGAGSHLVGDLAQANAFVVIPEDVTEIPAGGAADVMVLERRLS